MDDLDLFLQAHQNTSKVLPANRLKTFSSDSESHLIDQLLQKIPANPTFSPVQPSMTSGPLSPTSALLLRQIPPPVVQCLPPPPVPLMSSISQGEPLHEVNALEQKLIETFRNSPVLGSPSPMQLTTSPRFFDSSPSAGSRSHGYKNTSPLGDKPLRRPKEPDRLDMEVNNLAELHKTQSVRELKFKELESQLMEERRSAANKIRELESQLAEEKRTITHFKVKYTGENDQLKRKIESLLEEKLNDFARFDDTVKKVWEENETLKQSVMKLNSEKDDLLAVLEQLKSDIARLRDENMNTNEDNRKLSSANLELQVLTAENGRLKEELASCVSTRSTLEACAKTMTEDIKALKKELVVQKEVAEAERNRLESDYMNRMRGIRDCFLSGGSEVPTVPAPNGIQPSLPQSFSTKSYLDLERQEQELLTKLMELPSRGLPNNERQRLTIQLKTQLKIVKTEMEYIKMAVSSEM